MYDIFSLPKTEFPSDFLWGSSTAAHQIEGDNVHSNFWHREQQGGVWSQWDVEARSGKACNHYELYREDADLIASLGHQVYRMSIEWSRIEPLEGQWNADAVAHYVDLLERLNAKGVKVMVTLHHFTHPLWFENLGEFSKRENCRYFFRFVQYLVPQIKHLVYGWNIFNEFNRGGYYGAPRKFHILYSHAMMYRYLKSESSAMVSSAHALSHFEPVRPYDRFDNIMTEFLDYITNEFFFHAIRTGEINYPDHDSEFIPELKGATDFWAINYYTREMVDSRTKGAMGNRYAHKTIKLIDKDFYYEEMFPEGLTKSLQRLKDYPVIITENGASANDDRFRIVHLATYLSAIREAIDLGVDVRGYIYWSTMDNYEWGSYKPRFGLVDVNFETFERTWKPSAHFYKEIIERNGFDSSLISNYLDDLPTTGR